MTKELHVRLMQPNRHARSKRWDMILRNMWTPGKYALPSVALALSGCVASPNVVSVSPDGRYVVVPMNESGVIRAPLDNPKKASNISEWLRTKVDDLPAAQ